MSTKNNYGLNVFFMIYKNMMLNYINTIGFHLIRNGFFSPLNLKIKKTNTISIENNKTQYNISISNTFKTFFTQLIINKLPKHHKIYT
ncbi:hypothetical protein EV197_1872 [Aquimarina brevivitae]|uniref:Uncharacterized protein n=1 Tax=Aquimarina brevivitae TaxID=323412 RepID=A0A4Q7P0U6_9FLAO|nr:hypothetical protein EV197_1872 [Aquimarina brevivitae]